MKHARINVLARVVQKVDNTIQRIAWFVLLTLIHCIAIYPVDSVIQPLNNPGLKYSFFFHRKTDLCNQLSLDIRCPDNVNIFKSGVKKFLSDFSISL